MVSCVYIAIDKNGLKENKGNALNMKKFLKCVFKRVVFLHMLRLQYGLHAKESGAINHHYSLLQFHSYFCHFVEVEIYKSLVLLGGSSFLSFK